MEKARSDGATVLAIPHNGNASDGRMFPTTNAEGKPLNRAYAEARMKNEPVYEVTQIKGTSETHPVLSPNDEFAGFELWDYLLASTQVVVPKNKKGSYARQALLDGLAMDIAGQGNPYHFGLIGDSDTHNAAAAIEEDNYTGKFGVEASAKNRLEGPVPGDEINNQRVREFSSGGLAGIWAESNTREALFEAVRRKETFATTGTRLQVRFFGGWEFGEQFLGADDWVKRAYGSGVPMGSDLKPVAGGAKAPEFVIFAIKDPDGANLDRVQVVKGWIENGKQMQKIYDVAASGGRQPGPDGKMPTVGNTVNVAATTYENSIGAPELQTVWTDPDFDEHQHAFYYVRVIEIPTPRWSTYDAKTLGVPPRKDLPASIQERGWSSPIWYRPKSSE